MLRRRWGGWRGGKRIGRGCDSAKAFCRIQVILLCFALTVVFRGVDVLFLLWSLVVRERKISDTRLYNTHLKELTRICTCIKLNKLQRLLRTSVIDSLL